MMNCPNCNHEIEVEAAFCPHCGTRLADGKAFAEARTPVQPSRRNTVLGVFAFILSLLSAWTTFLSVFVEKTGFLAGAPQQVQGLFCVAGTFFCLLTALLAFFSLFGRNIKRGLGIFALILSLGCLAVLHLPAADGLLASSTEAVKKVTVVSSAPILTAATLEKGKEESSDKTPEAETGGAWSQTIATEDVYLTVEQVSESDYRLTIDNQSDRDVNFGWVRDSVYVLILTEQGKYRSEINESQFNPVKAYTQRTIPFSLPSDAGATISFRVENLYHLDSRGLPSNGVMEDLLFVRNAK